MKRFWLTFALFLLFFTHPAFADVTLQAKALLQGAYDTPSGLMRDDLRSKGYLPPTQPYNFPPFNYAGSETASATLLAVTGDKAVVDWVLLDVRDNTSHDLLARKAVMVQRDGTLLDPQTGNNTLTVTGIDAGTYSVSIHHRNHLGAVVDAVALSAATPLLNFSAKEPLPAGDVDANAKLISSGPSNDVTILLGYILTEPQNSQQSANYRLNGYFNTDLNLDGVTVYAGPNNDLNLLQSNVLLHPNNHSFSMNFIVEGAKLSHALPLHALTANELLAAALAELANKKAIPPLLTALYGTTAIAYAPGHNTQLLEIDPWVENVLPILSGTEGNTLALAGNTASARYAAFGVPPTDLFAAGQSLAFEAPFGRLLAWLLAGEPLDSAVLTTRQTVALSMTAAGSRSKLKTWLAQQYPTWAIVECNSVASLASCYSTAALVVTDGGSNTASDAFAVKQVLIDSMAAGKPVLYLHTEGWGVDEVSIAVASLMRFSLPYGGNWWADDVANWVNVNAMQSADWDKHGLAGIETVLNHFKAGDYTQTGLDTTFYPGANKVRAVMTALDERKINLFQTGESRLYRLLALLGDRYRQAVKFPMDKDATNATVFLKALFADHAVYNYRAINPAQPDMGNFSRSDFSHITPVTKTVTLTSRQNFRAAGVYALPGQTVTVTRKDNSATTTTIFVNSLRAGSTHEFETNGYKRPKWLQSAAIPLLSGETIAFTSPYGGALQIAFNANDQPVEFVFENVGEHPFWDGSEDNASFTAKLAKGDYDWAEFVTPAFEIHSTLDKMRQSASDTRWGGTLEGFAAATMRYTHNFPHVLAGFKGPGIDVVPEIHDFAAAKGFSIDNLDLVKHMNADQATCGYGCSGNPYDAYWAFDPIGHGDIHELGHGLEKSRFRLDGWNYHASTNPYSYYSKTQYFNTTGGEPECQSLPFKEAFDALQASVGQADPVAYLKTNYWDAVIDNWSRGVSMTLQMMMLAEDQGKLADGWHLLARLHILEREFNRALASDVLWDSKKVSLGFASFTRTEAAALASNDWMVIASAQVTALDYRDYLTMWGITFSAKAAAQVASFNYAVAPRAFFISSPQGYCKGEGFDGEQLPVDGGQVWPLATQKVRLMGNSFR
ncbi:ImpA family metalloprotease [Thiothrix subterranea]|uniref:ImpA family metalloprotease n=1 Tax=Thiothrix subterranea TaxID=2735563 RepID=A0AA51MLT1_9GAMM|nr:ImpA family metalloprotease [Thiothrix subterranea]MDQ5768780.1 ImpA family metalloprotease [Thiothrix subterranea]WML86538.1 ImpA family metalloprotease [Thiothrix subterranea]